MKLEIHLLNCMWLLFPLIAWNIVLGPKLVDPRLTSDAHSAAWQLYAENGGRILVFALPLLIPLQLQDTMSRTGLNVYIIGMLVYFASWLPLILAPQSTWSQSSTGVLAPFITPLLVFGGIAMIGPSLLYGVISVLFIILHTRHGIQNLSFG